MDIWEARETFGIEPVMMKFDHLFEPLPEIIIRKTRPEPLQQVGCEGIAQSSGEACTDNINAIASHLVASAQFAGGARGVEPAGNVRWLLGINNLG